MSGWLVRLQIICATGFAVSAILEFGGVPPAFAMALSLLLGVFIAAIHKGEA